MNPRHWTSLLGCSIMTASLTDGALSDLWITGQWLLRYYVKRMEMEMHSHDMVNRKMNWELTHSTMFSFNRQDGPVDSFANCSVVLTLMSSTWTSMNKRASSGRLLWLSDGHLITTSGKRSIIDEPATLRRMKNINLWDICHFIDCVSALYLWLRVSDSPHWKL